MTTRKMLVRVVKLNSGVRMEQVGKRQVALRRKDGRVTAMGLAFQQVEDLYRLEVIAAFVKARIDGSGYAQAFLRSFFRTDPSELTKTMELEPWGFALVAEDGGVSMGDTGSTPTSGRASALACYQAPLGKVERPGERHCTFEKVYSVEVDA
jgi:hypothetical protein